jgi:PBP1b-binding outer membrane lipoprotein LpoB
MKKFATLALLLSIGLFAAGCKKEEAPATPAAPAAPAATEGAPADAAPADAAPAN